MTRKDESHRKPTIGAANTAKSDVVDYRAAKKLWVDETDIARRRVFTTLNTEMSLACILQPVRRCLTISVTFYWGEKAETVS
jgi:hypothetical protein